MVNKVILIGNLGKDPEVRALESGISVGRFSIATNESYLDKSGEWQTLTEWHNVVVWRNLAERAEKNLKKGMQVFVEGKLTTRKWEGQDGKDNYTTEVVAQSFRILGKRERSDSDYESNFPGSEDEKIISNSPKPAVPDVEKPVGNAEEKVDDLPF